MEANLEEMTDSGLKGTGRRKARCTKQLHMGSEGEESVWDVSQRPKSLSAPFTEKWNTDHLS